MSDTSFQSALAFVLDVEGGYSNDRRDPGGSTSRGITQAKLNEVRAAHPEAADFPKLVSDLTDAQVAWIYRTEYWDRLSADLLPDGIALAAFNCAVNAGVSRAARFLQQALRVSVDGVIGAQTIAAVKRAQLVPLIEEFNARLCWHYMLQDEIDDDFGLGWARRLMKVHTKAVTT